MVRKASAKKRRAGRIGKTKLKNRNYQFYKPPQFTDGAVRTAWDSRKSPSVNMANMGLRSLVNNEIITSRASSVKRNADGSGAENSKAVAIELFDIPDSDTLIIPGKTLAMRMLPVSIEDQKYMRKCLAKYGDDYGRMARDIKVNDMQHTENKVRKMAARFFLLTESQLRVEVPEKVKHLMACGMEDADEK